MTKIPMPGDEFDGQVVVASGWVNDDFCGVLLLGDTPGEFYSIAEYERVVSFGNHGEEHGAWRQTFSQVYANIVPAARAFDEAFGFWGEP